VSGTFGFAAQLWRHEGDGGWHFLTVPAAVSADIDARSAGRRKGFGSVRVQATIGSTTWATSVFPDAKRSAYLLPVKKEVRATEGIGEGDRVRVALDLIEG
jgi:hypothetical protein